MSSKTILRRLLTFVKTSKWLLVFAFLSSIIFVVLNLVAPILIGDAIDDYLAHASIYRVVLYCIALTCVYLGYSLFQWVLMYTSNKIAFSSSASLRKLLYDKMQKLPISFFDSHAHGDLISRYINDIDIVADGLLQGLSTIISGTVSVVFCIAIMLKLNLVMSIVVILSAPFTYLVARTITVRSQKYFRQQASTLGKLNGYSEEMLSQIKTVKAYQFETQMNEHFQETNEVLYHAGVKSQFYGSLANPSTRFVTNIAYACVGLAGALLALSGEITIGSISIFLMYSNVFSKPFNEITGVITQLQSGVASARRIFTILDMEEEPQDEHLPKMKQTKGDIQFTNVSFAYVSDQPLIENLCLHIKAGSKVAIVGRTGAGKTTLVNLLMRFYDIQSGTISIDGMNVVNYTRDSLRQQFGMVLQDTYLFEDSIAANIAYGKKDATREEIMQAAKQSGAHEFIRKLKHGYDTILHTNSSSLSQGQRQLLSITRVLLKNPSILILDEATSSIDTRSEQHVNNAMKQLMEGKTSFVIAHRLSTIIHSDFILVMEHGHIIEQGTHEELLSQHGSYTQLYESQFQ